MPSKTPTRDVKYEFVRRKEEWNKRFAEYEKGLIKSPEKRPNTMKRIISDDYYEHLAKILKLPVLPDVLRHSQILSEKSLTEDPPQFASERSIQEAQDVIDLSRESYVSGSFVTETEVSGTEESELQASFHDSIVSLSGTTETESDDYHSLLSAAVQVSIWGRKRKQIDDTEKKRKALVKFLKQSSKEAATWRPKETKSVDKLDEMTLEEKGDFLHDMIISDFWKWLSKISGKENTFADEDTLKDFFQVSMDNPASRNIRVKIKEKNILSEALADFLGVPEKSFHHSLLKHLKWDAKMEKLPPRKFAFGKHLQLDLRFAVANNKTAETWLEWNRLQPGEASFADVYADILNLCSTSEYCKWLAKNPQWPRPKYLEEIGKFDKKIEIQEVEAKVLLEQMLQERKNSKELDDMSYTYEKRNEPVKPTDPNNLINEFEI